MKKYLVFVFMLIFACCASAEAAQYGKIAAVVNGKAITMYDLQEAAAGDIIRARLNPDSPKDKAKVDAILRKTLDAMISDILLQQEAQRLGVKITDKDIDQEITAMYTSRGMTKQQFEKSLAKEGVKLSKLRENYRKGMTRQRIIAMEGGRRVVIKPEEIKAYYEKNKADMYNRDGLHMALIVYHPQAPAATIARKVKNGEISWLEASQKYSVMPDRNKGGDTGPVRWDQLNGEWSRRLSGMQPGDVTDLFNYNAQLKAQVRLFRPNGDNSPLRIMTLEEATPMIDAKLRGPKAQERIDEYLKSLRDKALIDIRI
ncbi:MAG: peptidylprolyl isomerase [Desulfovibrionaceae bacterium]|nr:peptidylprolyl isomerase [Desulfovibrionaceae bacterium]